MRRALAASALALVVAAAAGPALAASGSLNDPDDKGDPDVLKLSYANRNDRAVTKMKYDPDSFRPQIENFYVKWGSTGKKYQLKHSSADGTSLWYYDGSGEPSEETCSGDRVRFDAEALVSTGTIPRSCMSEAPGRVRFQGIAVEGQNSDPTRTSDLVRKG